jgi:hypothetical protein
MSIFNLQTLEEQIEDTKAKMEDKKSKKNTTENNSTISESIFSYTLKSIDEISKKVNANIAYRESLLEDVVEDPSLFKDMISKYINSFNDIKYNFNTKIDALLESINILKYRLDSIEETEDDKTLNFKTHYTYTNLGLLKSRTILKTLIDNQLDMDTSDINSFEDIGTFRNNIRTDIIFSKYEDNVELDKWGYIEALFYLFRNGKKLDEAEVSIVSKSYLLDSINNCTNFLPKLFNADIDYINDFLISICNREDLNTSDIILKRISIILEQYTLLFSARADAIVEYANTVRDQAGNYVEVYGGDSDDI